MFAGTAQATEPARSATAQAVVKPILKEEPAQSTPAKGAKPETGPAVKAEPVKTPVAAAEAPQTPAVAAAPAAADAVKQTESALPQSCPNCFLPLPAGYKSIMDELTPWTAEMAAQATDCDRVLSSIQKQINEKEKAIESAKLGTEKKAVKAAVKSLTKERKILLKEYSAENDKKTAFYKQFSKELAKKADAYNKIVIRKLKEAQSAAAMQ